MDPWTKTVWCQNQKIEVSRNDHSKQNFENLGPIRTGQSVDTLCKKYSNPCRPFMQTTVQPTTITIPTTSKSNMFMWSGWSDWERSRDKKKTHIRQRFCMNERNFVESGPFGNQFINIEELII